MLHVYWLVIGGHMLQQSYREIQIAKDESEVRRVANNYCCNVTSVSDDNQPTKTQKSFDRMKVKLNNDTKNKKKIRDICRSS